MSAALPARPDLEHLRKQAKALLRAVTAGDPSTISRVREHVGKLRTLSDDELGDQVGLSDAQHVIARTYGFASWGKLKDHVDHTWAQATAGADTSRPLPNAANDGTLDQLRQILSAGQAMQHDLDLALARSAMHGRLDIAEELIRHGANVNGEYGGNYGPIILAACEAHNPAGLKFLIEHGARVTFGDPKTKYPATNTPMRMIIGGYLRRPGPKHECIELLIEAGAEFDDGPVMDIHQGRADLLARRIDAEPSLARAKFDLDYGTNLTLRRATLLHIAAEFNERECVDVLLSRGADLNARADVTDAIGAQTPIYHVIGGNQGACYELFEHLLSERPDLTVKAKVQSGPTIYSSENNGDVLEVTPLEYARRYEKEPAWRQASREVKRLTEIADR